MTDSKEREAFERWVTRNDTCDHTLPVARNKNGDYADEELQPQWEAWQARAKAVIVPDGWRLVPVELITAGEAMYFRLGQYRSGCICIGMSENRTSDIQIDWDKAKAIPEQTPSDTVTDPKHDPNLTISLGNQHVIHGRGLVLGESEDIEALRKDAAYGKALIVAMECEFKEAKASRGKRQDEWVSIYSLLHRLVTAADHLVDVDEAMAAGGE